MACESDCVVAQSRVGRARSPDLSTAPELRTRRHTWAGWQVIEYRVAADGNQQQQSG